MRRMTKPTTPTIDAASPRLAFHSHRGDHRRLKEKTAAALICALAVLLSLSACTHVSDSVSANGALNVTDRASGASSSAVAPSGSLSSTAEETSAEAASAEQTGNQAAERTASASTPSPAIDLTAAPYSLAAADGHDLASASFSQLVLVNSSGSSAVVTCYEKDAGGVFRPMDSIGTLDGYVGENGVGTPSEGSETTPAGLFDIPFAFGNAENPGTKMMFLSVDENAWWSSEVGTGTYNAYVESDDGLSGNSEHLAGMGEYYDYAAVIGYNFPSIGAQSPDAVEGAGSAFFLHVYYGPTQGCVGVSHEGMEAIMRWLDPACNPHILIM